MDEDQEVEVASTVLGCTACEYESIDVEGLPMGKIVVCPSCGKTHKLDWYYEKDGKWHAYLHDE